MAGGNLADRATIGAADGQKTSDRDALLRALADLALLPPSLVSPQERGLLDAMLAPIISRFDDATRKRLVERLVKQVDGPRDLAMALALEPIDVAKPLLLEGDTLKAGDLVSIIRNGTFEHRLAIADRRGLESNVADTLIEFANPEISCRLLANRTAELSLHGIEALTRQSAGEPRYQSLLLTRPEMSVRLAHLMFWWSGPSVRVDILRRFTAERRVSHKAMADLLLAGIEESPGDEQFRLVLSLVGEAQAIAKPRFMRLINLAEGGLREDFAADLADAARIRIETLHRIIADPHGEPLSVLAKAIGLNRREFGELIVVVVQMREASLPTKQDLERMTAVFDEISTDRADMALHSWDVAFATEDVILPIDHDDDYSAAL